MRSPGDTLQRSSFLQVLYIKKSWKNRVTSGSFFRLAGMLGSGIFYLWSHIMSVWLSVQHWLLSQFIMLNTNKWFMYCWSLTCRILSITLQACEMSAIVCGSLSILWHCLSLGLEWKLTFSRSVATAEFSKFAGILSVALSQHHLSGFEIAQLEFHHLH